MIWATIIMALREIRRNGMRSLLTMLGVVIGVGAVIALVSVGRGATAKVTEDIAKLGKNLLTVNAGTFSRGGGGAGINAPPLRLDDANAIRREILGVEAVAAAAASSAQVVYGNSNQRTSVTGSDNSFFEVRGYNVDKGRLFSRAELQSGAATCVIGSTVRSNLFQSREPIGTTIRVGSVACQVVGLLASKGQAGMGQDQDDLVVMPMRAVQRRITGNDNIQTIFVAAAEGQGTGVVAERVRGLLRQRRHRGPGLDDDFMIRDMAEIAETVTGASTALTALLGAIAAVSLLVGGIGIMNIMLVSVTERTREIGIRLAIGAFGSEVMMQFLLEAIVLSTLGGVIGICLGLTGSYFAAEALQVPYVFAPDIVALAFVFSALVGVVFGYLPARKAAGLDPIEALRHE
ncbi:MAG TPA: ABC transporter permease [Polyangiaceae bacterium]|nr:ABC transporter permease [Polyangiaceae bacterium]